MNPGAYKQILIASIAGGLAGFPVMWNRRRSQSAGESKLRELAVMTVGTGASGCALIAFVYPILHLRYVTWRLEAWSARMRRSGHAERVGSGAPG